MDHLFFQEKAAAFLLQSPLNQVRELNLKSIYSTPLFAVANANDPLFEELKKEEIIGPYHLSPKEWLKGAKSVICYFLPFSSSIRKANYGEGLPAQEWLYGRIEGEELNHALRRYLLQEVEGLGAEALIPLFDPRYTVINKKSNYSERHVAFIAGLGTFGLSRCLITTKGSAGRFGSLITSLELKTSPRPYQGKDDYCNYCGDCIKRCPARAIKSTGKDLDHCASYLDQEIRPRYTPRYGCGKCQTKVSCEEGLPR